MTDKAKWMNNCSDELTVNYLLTLILLENLIGQVIGLMSHVLNTF